MSAPPPRHTLVWPDADGRERLRRSVPVPTAAAVVDWVEAGHPLVLRRRSPGDLPDAWPLALSAPASGTGAPSRFAMTLPAAEIARHAAPPTLDALLDAGSLPAAWHPRVRVVLALGRRHGTTPRVFGGALWQHLSGQPRLHANSDLDLLWPREQLASAPALGSLLAELIALPDEAPRLDGELLFPDGSGAQWRELATVAPTDAVLLKTAVAVRLVSARTLLSARTAA